MESSDGYDHLCMPIVDSFVFLLVVVLTLYIFVLDGVGCAYMCGLAVDLGMLCFRIDSLCICVFLLWLWLSGSQ